MRVRTILMERDSKLSRSSMWKGSSRWKHQHCLGFSREQTQNHWLIVEIRSWWLSCSSWCPPPSSLWASSTTSRRGGRCPSSPSTPKSPTSPPSTPKSPTSPSSTPKSPTSPSSPVHYYHCWNQTSCITTNITNITITLSASQDNHDRHQHQHHHHV